MEAYTHRQIHDLLVSAKHPVFVSDERIDGDSLGASLAVVDYCRQLGKTVPVYVASSVPEQYRRLPRVEACTEDLHIFDNPDIDLVVVFDCSDGDYVKRLLDRVVTDPKVINIDHHMTNSRYGHVNQVLTDAPATAEVIHRFFLANQIIPSKQAATCLLTGICFDTTAFSNASTNERALRAASDLMMSGARIQDVIRTMFHTRSIAALRVWGTALERLQKHSVLHCITTCLTRHDLEVDNVTEEEIEGLSNFLNLVIDVEMLMVLRECPDGGVKVSLRSSLPDVSAFAKAFGGGGHKKAAGFTIPNARLVCERTGEWRVEIKPTA